MCECLDYDDGDRYQCVVCADMSRGLLDENQRLRLALDAATRERDEAQGKRLESQAQAMTLLAERDEAREACRDEAWKARNVSAALDRFAASAREAMSECIGRDMEIAAAKALSKFWREIGVDE